MDNYDKKTNLMIFSGFVILAIVAGVLYVSYFLPIGNRSTLITHTKPKELINPDDTVVGSIVGVMTSQELKNKLDNNESIFVIDLRSASDYEELHIPGSINSDLASIELQEEAENYDTYAFICNSLECIVADQKLNELAWENAYLIPDGVTEWNNNGYDLEGTASVEHTAIAEITTTELNQLLKTNKSLVIIDIREKTAYDYFKIPGAINIPFIDFSSTLSANVQSKNVEVIIYDEMGLKSRLAAQEMIRQEYKNIKILTGGIEAWIDAGF
ncbi:MAG: rhodanese-like domain-containing protein [bacterium]